MLLVGKDKRKIAVHKGKGWNREVKFEPVLVFGTYEGFGNTEIKLWKPISNGKFAEVRNNHKRKHRKNLNLLKKKGKSLTIAAPQKANNKGQLAMNDQFNVIKDKTSNQGELINYSSPDTKTYNSIKRSLEQETHLFIPNFFSNYSNGNEEYNTQAQFVTKSETLKYTENKQMTLKPIIQNLLPPNLIEYARNIEGEGSGFKSHFSSEFFNQNKEHVNSSLITNCESLKNVTDELKELDLSNKSNSKHFFLNAVTEFESDKVENKLFVLNTTSNYVVYASNESITEPEAFKNIPDELLNSNLNSQSSSKKKFSSSANEFSSDSSEKKLFLSNTSLNNIVYNNNWFIRDSETLKKIPDELIDSNLINKSNSEKFVHNAIIEVTNDSIDNKLFSSNISSNYKEYTSSQFIAEPETLQYVPDELVKSVVVNEFPSNNKLYINTPQCTSPHPSTLISLEELASKSYGSYQNIKESWSVGSSKVLMTPSKLSIKSGGLSTPEGSELIQQDENANTRESTCKAFDQLLDALDANLNVIIDDHQLKEQTKLQVEKDSNLNYSRNTLQSQDQAMEMGQNIVNDNQNNNQTMEMTKDDHLSKNTHIKFTVLKKYQENDETLLDSSEDIENNIFIRNKISPCFENSTSNCYYRKGKKMLLEKCETDYEYNVSSKNDSFADILHDSIYFETRAQSPKAPQQSTDQMINIDSFNCLKNCTDKSTNNLFNNKNMHASDETIKKSFKGGSKNELCLENSGNEKARDFSLSPMNSSQNYYNELFEYTKSLATTLSEIGTPYIEEMMEHGLEQTLGTNVNNNSFFEFDKANHCNLSNDSKNNIQNITNVPDDELLHNLVSKSKINIKNSDKYCPEIEKCTNEIICNIIRARTEEDHPLLISPQQNQPEKERIKKNSSQEILNRKIPELQILEEKEPKPLNNEELHFLSVPKSTSTLDSNFNDQLDNIFSKYKKEESDKTILNQKFTLLNSSLEMSSTNLQSITTQLYLVKGENEVPENLKIINDEKEKSSLIINAGHNEKQSTALTHDSIASGSSLDEKAISPREKNIQNTNLYFMRHQVKSPYLNIQSKQNMIVNFGNARKKNIQDKFFSCFRKLNFLAKKKSAASHRTDKSNS